MPIFKAPLAGPPAPTTLGGAAEQLRAVLAVSRALTRAEDEDELLRLVARSACEHLGFGFCLVALREPDGDFHTRATAGSVRGTDPESLRSYVMPGPVFERLTQVAQRLGSVLWVPGDDPVHEESAVAQAIVKTEPTTPWRDWLPASVLLVPLVDPEGEVVGLLNPDDPLDGLLPGPDQAVVLETFAHLATIALEVVRARALERARIHILDAQRRQLEGLLEASAAVKGRLGLDDVLLEIARAMTGAAGFGRAAVYLVGTTTGQLTVRATVGVPAADDARLRSTPVTLADFAALMRPAMRIGRSYLFDHRRFSLPQSLLDVLSVPRDPPGWTDGQWHPLDSLTVPMYGPEGAVLGLISVDEPMDGRFPRREHITALEFFADQCAVAVNQARRHDELRALALTDPLTGLPNRRAFTASLANEVEAARRRGSPLALLFIDLDHFKDVNDSFGHAVGDRVLTTIAGVMRDRLRRGDVIARFGGEEFVVLLPSAGITEAARVAEDLRTRVAATQLAGIAGVDVRISVGVGMLRAGNAGAERLLADADAALYRAKEAGRDRVCATPDIVPAAENGRGVDPPTLDPSQVRDLGP
ncbi:MAG: sensor domain-containing diguanylate cyclase [Actinomycetes bacterium]